MSTATPGIIERVRVLLAAINCPKGDLAGNVDRHLDLIQRAGSVGCELIVFPEMSLTGSVDPIRHPERAIPADADAVFAVAAATGGTGVTAIFGIAENVSNTRFYIAQVLASEGRVESVYRKRHLGDDEVGFTTGNARANFQLCGRPVGVAICAEGSVDYPFDEAFAAGARVVFFCAAPGLYGRRTDDTSWRRGFEWWQGHGLGQAIKHSRRLGIAIALVTQAGSTGDEEFPGIAALVNASGEVVNQLPDWREGTLVVEIDV